MTESDVKTFSAESCAHWREWLEKFHQTEKSVWLIFHKNTSKMDTISWSEAVDEALCFGWIDSIAKPLDQDRFMRFFTRRKPKSAWSRINKEKVLRLTIEGRMSSAGLESIETAKQNGSWTALDEVEDLIIPQDLEKELSGDAAAKMYFENLSRSSKKAVLQWLMQAKRAQTRSNRIEEIIMSAKQNLVPKAVRWTKKDNS